MITVACPACRKLMAVPDNAAGKQARCPQCGQICLIPAPPSKPSIAPEPPPRHAVSSVPIKSAPPAPSQRPAPPAPPKTAQVTAPKPSQRETPPLRSSNPAANLNQSLAKTKPSAKLWMGLGVGGAATIIAGTIAAVVTSRQPLAEPIGKAKAPEIAVAAADEKAPPAEAQAPPADLSQPMDAKTPIPGPAQSLQNKSPSEPSLEPAPVRIDPATVRKVKHATVYLRVSLANKEVAEGSGFFAAEPGLVWTNAHVVGMLNPDSKAPEKIEVVLHSGEANETRLAGKVLGTDRIHDLAVVQVDGDAAQWPAVLPFGDTTALSELQDVYIFGFPFGSQLGKNITISNSTISSLRKDSDGGLAQIQVNGGMHPGNSGGPLVDARGAVIGVAVAIIKGTQVNFAVPSDHVRRLLGGRVAEMEFGEPFTNKGQTFLPVTVTCLDPLKRLRDLHLETWTGKQGTKRPGSNQAPASLAGDGPRQRVPATLNDGTARFELPIPPLEEGQAFWIQPAAGGPLAHWGSARPFRPGDSVPLVRQPAELRLAFNDADQRTLTLKRSTHIKLTKGNEQGNLSESMDFQALEVVASTPQGAAVQVHPGHIEFSETIDGKNNVVAAEFNGLLKQVLLRYVLSPEGSLQTRTQPDFVAKLVPGLRDDVEILLNEMATTYEAFCLGIPNRQVQPLETWTARAPMLLVAGGKRIVSDLLLTCTFEGVRGEQHAFIRLGGNLQKRDQFGDVPLGKVSGHALLDLQRGYLTEAKIIVRSEFGAGQLFAVRDLELTLTRQPGNPTNIALVNPNAAPPIMANLTPGGNGPALLSAVSMLTPADPIYARSPLRLPHKVHNVSLRAGTTYVIDMIKLPGSGVDPYLFLESPTGTLLAQDDNSGGGLNARIRIAAPQTGAYRIIAATFNRAEGRYVIRVTEGAGANVASVGQPPLKTPRPAGQAPVLSANDAAPPRFNAPLAEDQTSVKLPSPVQDVVAAADGRLLILHLASEQKLAIFDLAKSEIVETIPAEDIQLKFAAGADKLIVIHGFAKAIESWDLTTLKQIKRADLPVGGPVKAFALGSASKGPALLVWGVGSGVLDRLNYEWLDLDSLTTTPVVAQGFPHPRHWRTNVHVRAAANGRVFSFWATGQSPAGVETLVVSDGAARYFYQHTSAGMHLMPGPDGKYLFASGVWNAECKQIDELGKNPTIPALSGNYYIDLNQSPIDVRLGKGRVQPAVYEVGKAKPLATLPYLDVVELPETPPFTTTMTADRRVFLVPSAGVMAHIPLSNDQIVLTKVNLQKK